MEYCLSDGDGSATMWTAAADTDSDGDGSVDAVGLDFDNDGLIDDAMADLDADGIADHLLRDHAYYTDDGTGTWSVSVDRTGQLRWFGLDGAEHSGTPVVDVDADGRQERLLDIDGDGLADRALGDRLAYVDSDSDGRWDVKLTDGDGDGRADGADEL